MLCEKSPVRRNMSADGESLQNSKGLSRKTRSSRWRNAERSCGPAYTSADGLLCHNSRFGQFHQLRDAPSLTRIRLRPETVVCAHAKRARLPCPAEAQRNRTAGTRVGVVLELPRLSLGSLITPRQRRPVWARWVNIASWVWRVRWMRWMRRMRWMRWFVILSHILICPYWPLR